MLRREFFASIPLLGGLFKKPKQDDVRWDILNKFVDMIKNNCNKYNFNIVTCDILSKFCFTSNKHMYDFSVTLWDHENPVMWTSYQINQKYVPNGEVANKIKLAIEGKYEA